MSDILQDKLVSIIVPAYNAEKYIEKCLESILEQTYGNTEIIVVDDGSIDGTYDIIISFLKRDSRIQVIKKENGGVSSARNLGLKKANGKYISFLDADDIMERTAISTLVDSIERSGADWISCQYSRWDKDDNKLEDYNFITGERLFTSDEERISFLLNEYFDYKLGYEVWGKLFKADIIKKNNLFFSEKCRIGEDLAFNIKYLMHSDRLNCISDRCIRYMIHDDSAMSGHKTLSDKINEDILLLEDVYEHISSTDNSSFGNAFSVLFAKFMEHSYIGKSSNEVVDAYKNISDILFAKKVYSELSCHKKELMAIFNPGIAKLKYKYHMYVKSKLCGESAFDMISRYFYDFYRILRRRETIKNWKLPY